MQNYKQKDRAYHQIIGDEYHQIVVEPREFLNSLLFQDIAKEIKPGTHMLDIGCGTGHMLVRFGPNFGDLVGVDHSESMLKEAAPNIAAAGLQAHLICQDVASYLQSQSLEAHFNLITCAGFLHHIDPNEFRQVLRNIFRILEPGGQMVIAEPIKVNLADLPKDVEDWNRLSIAPKLVYSKAAEDPDEEPLSLKHLLLSLNSAGFDIRLQRRAWELFPRSIPASQNDEVRIRQIHEKHGRYGNVFATLAQKPQKKKHYSHVGHANSQ